MYICMMTQGTLLFISGGEIMFIMLAVVLLFGADKIPDIARGLGKGMRTLKDATQDIKGEITKSAEKQGLDTNVAKDIEKELNKVKDDLGDVTGSISRKL